MEHTMHNPQLFECGGNFLALQAFFHTLVVQRPVGLVLCLQRLGERDRRPAQDRRFPTVPKQHWCSGLTRRDSDFDTFVVWLQVNKLVGLALFMVRSKELQKLRGW